MALFILFSSYNRIKLTIKKSTNMNIFVYTKTAENGTFEAVHSGGIQKMGPKTVVHKNSSFFF